VQTFLPTPMALATAMYHTRKNPLHKVTDTSEIVETVRAGKVRKLHKAFLRYHDPANWDILREGLHRMGRSDLIGNGPQHLVPRGASSPALQAIERKRETPGPAQLARKFGQNQPRPGAAVQRQPVRTARGKPGRVV
jgi:hypothetical protein